MRQFEIKKNRVIIKFQDDYYIVDKKTAKYFDILSESKNEEEFANKMQISCNKANKILSKIQNKILKDKYYKKNVLLPLPIKAQWKITNKCNLHCKHCYLGELNQESLTEDALMSIADKLINSGIMEVTITGGEALLVPNLVDIVKKFIKHNIFVKIFTNGTLLIPFLNNLDKSVDRDKLLKYIVFSVSVDGLQKTHDNIRGEGNFDKTLVALKNLVEHNYKIIVNCVINSFNYTDIPQLVKQLNDIGVKNIQLSNIIVSGNADKSMVLDYEKRRMLTSQLKNLSLNNGIHLFYGEEDGYTDKHFYDSDIKEGYFIENWKCCAGMTRITIDYTGNVYCCPFCTEYCLGNIITENLSNIWNNKNRFLFLDKLAKSKKYNNRMCLVAQKGDLND